MHGNYIMNIGFSKNDPLTIIKSLPSKIMEPAVIPTLTSRSRKQKDEEINRGTKPEARSGKQEARGVTR